MEVVAARNDQMIDDLLHGQNHELYPVVVISRLHDISHKQDSMTDSIKGAGTCVINSWHDFNLVLEPQRSYVITPLFKDVVDVAAGSMIDICWLVKTDESDDVNFDVSLLSTPHFFISRDGSSTVTIKDLDSEFGTFLNGIKLSSVEKYNVIDGDIISLGLSHLNEMCDLTESKYYVFKISFREFCNSRQLLTNLQSNINPFDAVLRNPLLVSEIIGNLDIYQLKHLRLVNKTFDTLISEKIGNETRICFDPPSTDDANLMKLWKDSFRLKVKTLETLKLRHVRLDFNECFSRTIFDVHYVIAKLSSRLTSLQLRMSLYDSYQFDLFLLVCKRVPYLESLDLYLFIPDDCRKIHFPFSLNFVRIMRLYCKYPMFCVHGSRLLFDLMSICPNTECVQVDVDNFRSLSAYQDQLNDDDNEDLVLPLEKLHTLEVVSFDLSVSFGQILSGISTRSLHFLKHLFLKNMEVYQIILDGLEEALERFAPFLETLHLEFSYAPWIWSLAEEDLDLRLPQFPKLEKLEIIVNGILRPVHLLMNWIFPSHQPNYAENFPSLQDLTLCSVLEDEVGRLDTIFESFVPLEMDDHNICHTMHNVRFEIPLNWDDEANMIWGREFMERVEVIFPHAVVTPNELNNLFD